MKHALRPLRISFVLTVVLFALASSAPVAWAGFGPVAANGVSPHGVPWTIRAKRFRKMGTLDFELQSPGYPDAGYFSSLRLPIPKIFFIDADAGSDLSPEPESDVSGVTSRNVTSLNVQFADGSSLAATPVAARTVAQKKQPWVKRLRFFDVFFSDALVPVAITALDANGQPLAGVRSHQGLFY